MKTTGERIMEDWSHSWWEWVGPARRNELVRSIDEALATAEGEMERLKTALNKIASWREGEEVTSAFDEPCSAKIAREALVKKEG